MKKPLTPEQAAILAPLHQAKALADEAWYDALVLLGFPRGAGVIGDLIGDDTYLATKDEPVPAALAEGD